MNYMTTQLLEIHPRELKFVVEIKKQSSCSIQLTNYTHHYVAFKVKTTSPKKYCVRPNVGIVKPNSTYEFTVIMQAIREMPPDMVCKDKFLIQSTIVPDETTDEDLTAGMFAKDNVRRIEENKLKVSLVIPTYSPVLSPINGALNDWPIYEDPVPADPVKSRLETRTPLQKNTVIVNESKILISKESKTVKAAAVNNELKRTYSTESPEKVYYVEDLGPANSVELRRKDIVNEDEELNATNDTELATSKKSRQETVTAACGVKLEKDINEMKSKLSELESKLNAAESKISELTEERKSNFKDREVLQKELASLIRKTVVKEKHIGFPLLFVCTVAIINLILGYQLHH